MNNENLGPAERIINTVLTFSDHLVHNRPGMVVPDPSSVIGVKWTPVTHKEEDDKKVVYQLGRTGKGKKVKQTKTLIGNLWADGTIRGADRRKVAEYRPAGIFPEVAVWMYQQAVEVWQLDNKFAAKWASFAFEQDHRGLKVVLAALMLVQSRKGDPVRENGEVLFKDDDYRDIGEAMLLIYDTRPADAGNGRRKKAKTKVKVQPKKASSAIKPRMLLLIHDVLSLDGVAEINRELGFTRSVRKPFLGRWPKVVKKWLWYREANPKLLGGLIKGGLKKTVIKLAKLSRYKPLSPKFFEALGWNQSQAKTGHRGVAIGLKLAQAETWEGLSEEAICERIVKERPSFKVIVGSVPNKPGITRAIVAAAIEAGSLSDKDLVNHSPMLEELGLMKVQNIRQRWEAAVAAATDMRAANIAANVKSKETRDKLLEGADKAVEKAVEEVFHNIRAYFFIDCSSSMQGAIEAAKSHIATFLQGFPLERTHVSHFNTIGQEVDIKHKSAAGVRNALSGIAAGGGTDYGAGIRALQHYKPADDEDVLMVFIGDEEAHDFSAAVRLSGLRPMAFGFIKIVGNWAYGQNRYHAVTDTAASLGIPCFMIDEKTFAVEGNMLKDPYAIPRIVKGLVSATPVGRRAEAPVQVRHSLAEQILQINLLQKPIWAEQIQV